MCKLKSALLLMLICLFCGQVPLQADSGWNIRIYRLQHAVRTMLGGDKAVCDGKEMPLAAASFKQEGVAYLPLRSVTCLADAEVGWNSRMRRAELTFADKRGLRTVAGFGVGDDRAFFGDASADAYSEKMGYPSILQQGRLFVPARYLALLLNRNLHYSNGEL
ncbi:MAG: stalk domain-containing protein, partial [bacterium]|nr:stalk domain-containing protein [bacterium]